MLDIGPIHRKEYELGAGRSGGSAAGRKGQDAGGAAVPDTDRVVIARAPGRIHFLGEHGDPDLGLYLSAAIDRKVKVAVSARKDNSLRFYAADLNERKRTTLVNLKYKREDRWANYIKIAIHIFAELGFPVKGLNFTVMGDIPQNIGLASSSAIETASAVALKSFLRAKIGDFELARRLADSHALFYEKKPESADYLIGLSARQDHFMVIDESDMSVQKIKSPLVHCNFLLMDSRVPRMGIDGELQTRKEELKTALEMLSQNRDGSGFRELAVTDLAESAGNLPEDIRRRSLHVVREIRRVLDARDCLIHNDPAGFSRMIFHSHESLRDLYEVSCPEIDWMVKRAQETEGILGARMTGQGFGGCTYAIVKNESVDEYRKRVEDYERIFGFRPIIYEVRLATGSRIVPC